MNDLIRKAARSSRKRNDRTRKRLFSALQHRDGCPQKPGQVEFFVQVRPDGIEVPTAHCLDCGVLRYEHGSEPAIHPKLTPASAGVSDQTKRELSEWILTGDAIKRQLGGISDGDMDVLYRVNSAVNAETWAHSVRLWIDHEVPTQIGLFSSDPSVSMPNTVGKIAEFIDVRTGELRRMLERL